MADGTKTKAANHSLFFADKLVIMTHSFSCRENHNPEGNRSAGTKEGEFSWKEREGGGWAWDEGSEPIQQQQQKYE